MSTAFASSRFAELEAALDNFERIHLDWVDSKNRTNPDPTYWDGVVALIEVFQTGDMPEALKPFGAAVEKLDDALEEFDDRTDVDNHMPRDSFWKAVEEIFALRKKQRTIAKPKRLETIQELNEQKVPHWQIAKIYSLLDDRGEPDEDAVKQELAKPGSVITKDWVHPDELERRRQLEERQERRATITSTTRRKVKNAKPVCPETVEQLWEQKVSVEQAAKMLGREVDEVQAEYDAFNELAQAEAAPSGKGGDSK